MYVNVNVIKHTFISKSNVCLIHLYRSLLYNYILTNYSFAMLCYAMLCYAMLCVTYIYFIEILAHSYIHEHSFTQSAFDGVLSFSSFLASYTHFLFDTLRNYYYYYYYYYYLCPNIFKA